MPDEEPEKPDERSRIRPWHVIVIFLAIPVLHIASGFVVSGLFDDWEKRGQFGDLFGAVNALFSGLAFAGVIVTILLQREELRLQRLELRQTREELRRSASAQIESEKALRAQAVMAAKSTRLDSINALMSFYENRATYFENKIDLNSTQLNHLSNIYIKIDSLSTRLDKIFDEINADT